jgi:pectin methylesterase-like acyl-CoA thioesterase
MKKSIYRIATLGLRFDSAPHWSAKLWLAVWFSALALTFGAQEMRAASVTYIVGTCVSGTHFSTIQSALDASPAPNTVEVCPGQYAEQVTITKPVTIEGIAAGNKARAQIILPDALKINATLRMPMATSSRLSLRFSSRT